MRIAAMKVGAVSFAAGALWAAVLPGTPAGAVAGSTRTTKPREAPARRPPSPGPDEAAAATLRPLRLQLRTAHWCISPTAPGGMEEAEPLDPKPSDPKSWFADLPYLQLRVESRTGRCRTACLENINIAAAEAITLWRAGCRPCSHELLAIVSTKTHLFLDERIYNGFALALGEENLVARIDALFQGRGTPEDNARFDTTRHVVTPYVRVPRSWEPLRALCDTGRASQSPAWARFLADDVCDSRFTGPHLDVAVVADHPCALPDGFVACSDPAKVVELSMRGFRYESEVYGSREKGPPPVAFKCGDPRGQAVDLDVVMLHEIGHFLGLPHLTVHNRPGFYSPTMQDVYDKDMCVSLRDLNMMSNAADAGWKYMAKRCEGLRVPRPAKAPAR